MNLEETTMIKVIKDKLLAKKDRIYVFLGIVLFLRL